MYPRPKFEIVNEQYINYCSCHRETHSAIVSTAWDCRSDRGSQNWRISKPIHRRLKSKHNTNLIFFLSKPNQTKRKLHSEIPHLSYERTQFYIHCCHRNQNQNQNWYICATSKPFRLPPTLFLKWISATSSAAIEQQKQQKNQKPNIPKPTRIEVKIERKKEKKRQNINLNPKPQNESKQIDLKSKLSTPFDLRERERVRGKIEAFQPPPSTLEWETWERSRLFIHPSAFERDLIHS